MKEVTLYNKSCNDNIDEGTANATEKLLDHKANDPADDINPAQENLKHNHKDNEQSVAGWLNNIVYALV